MKKKILVIAMPLLFICACKTSKKASADISPTTAVVMDESFRKPITDKYLFWATTEVVPLDTVYVAKDTLNIITKKITGCETENFKLIWNGNFSNAIPVQTSVKLLQYVSGDCRERHKFHLTYNISQLKAKTDTSAVRTTMIYVGGWKRLTSYVDSTARKR